MAKSTSERLANLGWRGWRRLRTRFVVPKERRVELKAAKKQLILLRDNNVVRTYAPSIIELGHKMQGDDRPIMIGPWISELGFEILYWIPFVKWFVAEFKIAPERLVFVSRGGMDAWYDRSDWNGAGRYIDIFSMMSPDAYRTGNEDRWQRGGGQKQGIPDPFEDGILRQAADRLGMASYHQLHPGLMYDFFTIFWTRGRRLSVGADAVTQHACHEPLTGLEPWTGTPLPESFVAVKFYGRPSFERTPETEDAVRRLLLKIAENRPVISLDTSFSADEHSGFPLPDHPNIASARDWMTPETNLGDQTRLMAAADLFIGTYGGTAYIPAFVGTPALGLYTSDYKLNFAHQMLVMRVIRKLGLGVNMLTLRECSLLADIVAGAPAKQRKECLPS